MNATGAVLCITIPANHVAAQHAVAGDLAFALSRSAKRLNRHVSWPSERSCAAPVGSSKFMRFHQIAGA